MRRLLVTLPLAPDELGRLEAALPGVALRTVPPPVSEADLAWADTVLGNVPAAPLIAARRVTWIHSPSVGLDAYTPVRMARPDLAISHSTGVMDDAVSEHALLLLLALARQLPLLATGQAERRWAREAFAATGRGTVVAGRAIHVLGFGAIGQRLVRKLSALGCRVTVYRRAAGPASEGAVRCRSFAELAETIGEADAVIGVLPSTPGTDGLLDAATLGRMRHGAWVINVGRGSLIDEQALVARLRDGSLGGAALDVFATEPLPASSALWSLPTVLITPHVAGRFDGEMAGHVDCFLRMVAERRGS
jgi:phosphoglycerate dehydrogenase-like enzyme